MGDAEAIEAALELEVLDIDLYRSVRLWRPLTGRGVFGGQVIGQAAWAATQSVESNFKLHSLHSYFLTFGDAAIPIIYHVDRLRDGRSYATRTVKAVQRGRAIFTLTCSFQVPEPKQPTFQVPMPKSSASSSWPDPDECKPDEDLWQAELDAQPDMPRKLREYASRMIDERRQSSIELRSTSPRSRTRLNDEVAGTESQAIWFRARAKGRDHEAFQRCVLAYASDMAFIGTAARTLGLGPRSSPKLAMMASLDHSMWFYTDVDASQWHLYHMKTIRAGNGRATVQGEIWTHDGKLAVVCSQEGVVRAEASTARL